MLEGRSLRHSRRQRLFEAGAVQNPGVRRPRAVLLEGRSLHRLEFPRCINHRVMCTWHGARSSAGLGDECRGLVVGDEVTSSMTRGPRGWAEGVYRVERPGSSGAPVSGSYLNRSSWGLRPLAWGQFLVEDTQALGTSISAGTARGTARGERSLAPGLPLPLPGSRRSAGRHLLPLLPRSREEGGRREAGRAALPRFGFLRQQPQQNSGGSARPSPGRPRRRDPANSGPE